MGLDKQIERNRLKNLSAAEYLRRLTPPSEEQKALTKEWILPYEALILEDVRAMREEVDQELRKDAEVRGTEKRHDREYPEGFCLEIRNRMFERIKAGMLDSSRPGLQALKAFVRKGGFLQPFW